jgi:Glycosyl hydrolase family 12
LQPLQQGTHRLISLAATGAAALTLLLVLTTALGVSAARADTTDCTGLNTIPTGNPLYNVENSNAPGGSACVTVTSNGTGAYRVGSTSFNSSAPEAPAQQFIGYKAIYTGCKFGPCLEPQYPALASSIISEPTNWSFSFNATGMKDAVYDMYFNTTTGEPAVPTGAELMVWLNHTSNLQLQGAGTLPDVTIENQVWHVSSVLKTTPLGSWNRIAFELANPTTSVTGLDMVPFIKQAESYGVISPNWYEQALEAGFEIWSSGNPGVSTTSFSAPPPTIASTTAPGGGGTGGGGTGGGGGTTGGGGSGGGSSSGKDRTKPTITMSLPVCSVTYSAHKCAALRRTAGAWEKVYGFAADNVKVKRVTITAVRAHKGRAPRKKITTTAKLLHGTAFKAALVGLTTGSWTFTARAVDTSGNARTTKPVRVNINVGLSPFQHLPSKNATKK